MSKLERGTWNVGGVGYSAEAAREIFKNKLVVFIGDSGEENPLAVAAMSP